MFHDEGDSDRRNRHCVRSMRHPAIAVPVVRSRLADYVELTKPRIAVMALFTVAAGYLPSLRAANGRSCSTLSASIVAGGAALNQLIERLDARMHRTANRPLPAGRISPEEAATAFGAGASESRTRVLARRSPPRRLLAALATVVMRPCLYPAQDRYGLEYGCRRDPRRHRR